MFGWVCEREASLRACPVPNRAKTECQRDVESKVGRGGPAPMQDAAAPWQGCCIDPRLRLRVSLAGLLLPLLHLRV